MLEFDRNRRPVNLTNIISMALTSPPTKTASQKPSAFYHRTNCTSFHSMGQNYTMKESEDDDEED
jgi:hypothetical protein